MVAGEHWRRRDDGRRGWVAVVGLLAMGHHVGGLTRIALGFVFQRSGLRDINTVAARGRT
jgi:hypothetical protein